jgi:histone acetyltransferase (RNA polymerase elongator complex component)
MLAAIEAWAREQGSDQITCTSTITALSFYERQGYVRAGEPIDVGGKAGEFPLSKDLGL